MSANKIDAIFFDFGGVFTHSPIDALLGYAESIKVDPMALGRLVFGDYAADTDHSWHRLERGEINFMEAAEDIVANAKKEGIVIDLMEAFQALGGNSKDPVRHDVVEKASDLKKQGYKMGLITNNIVDYREEWQKLFDVHGIFDEIVDSSQEGMRKPDPAIYRLAMERLNAVPERSVFLDDIESNLHPAKELGMHTVLVTTDTENTFLQLDNILTAGE